ncbi:MAG: hypothetical protein EBR95_11070 [Verrucomicrobia bacterium]|jgi:hypothetical protein|nr:hypothetical protein [Verrucomicrobiota bacterium]
MAPTNAFRLRWKGAVTGPFPLARVQELLRAGEISLLHNIEVDGRWMTLRDYLRGAGLTRVIAPTAEVSAGDAPPPPPGFVADEHSGLVPDTARSAAGENLERTVRAGYLWCGSTFLLPPLFALAVYAWHIVAPDTPPISLFILLTFTTALGCFLPVALVRRIGRTLDQEGLAEIRQTQSGLALVLACLGLLLWLWCFWIIVQPRP